MMKNEVSRFITKIFFSLMPLLFLAINFLFFEKSDGDLNRIGKISIEKDYRKIFEKEFNREVKYSNILDIDLGKEKTFDILTIGDSFSQQGNYGYQNYLSFMSLNVVNMDMNSTNGMVYLNPIQSAFQIANGDMLDKLKVKYIVLQSVERTIVMRGQNIDRSKVITLKKMYGEKTTPNYGLISTIKELRKDIRGLNNDISNLKYKLTDLRDYFLNNILYSFDKKAYNSMVYKMKLSQKMFSTKNNELLFIYEDITNLKYNEMTLINTLNNEFNALSKKLESKGVKLIVLPSPDKYDIYYPFILNNDIPENMFFDYFNEEKKDYIYINSKEILAKHINNGEKDIYFGDDTHWSPLAAEIIAKEIYRVIK